VPRILFHTLIIPSITYAHHRLSEELPRGLALLQALPWLVLDLFFPGVFWSDGNTLLGDNGDSGDADDDAKKNAPVKEHTDSGHVNSSTSDDPSGDNNHSSSSSSRDKNREVMTSLRERARSNRTNRDLAQLGRRHHLRSATRSPSKTRGSSVSDNESETGAEGRRGSLAPSSSRSPSASPAILPQGPTADEGSNQQGSASTSKSDGKSEAMRTTESSKESVLPPLTLDAAAPSVAATSSPGTPPQSPKHQPTPASSDQDARHHNDHRRSGSESRGSWGSSYWCSYALQARSLITGSQEVSIRDHLFDLALPPPSRVAQDDDDYEHHGRHGRRSTIGGGSSSSSGGRSQSLARTSLRPLAAPGSRSPRSRPVPKRAASMAPARSDRFSTAAEWAAAQALRASPGDKNSESTVARDGAKGKPSESSHPAYTLLPSPSSQSSSSSSTSPSSSSHVQHRLLRRSSADTLRHLNHSPSKHSNNSHNHLKKGDKSSSESKGEEDEAGDNDGANNRPAPRVRKMWNPETQSYMNMYSSSSSSSNSAGSKDGAANKSPDRSRSSSGLRRLSRSAQKNITVGVGRKI